MECLGNVPSKMYHEIHNVCRMPAAAAACVLLVFFVVGGSPASHRREMREDGNYETSFPEVSLTSEKRLVGAWS